MYPSRFEYLPARSVEEAVGALAGYGHEAKVLAGGQSLIPMMKLRLATPRVLIDISRLTHLAEVREVGPDLLIGAMVSEAALERSAVAGRWAPGLVDTSRVIADPLVRNLATVGGNAAHGDPANDHPATLVAAGASFTLVGPAGSRTVPSGDFFVDVFATALEPDEILTEIVVPKQKAGTGIAYVKYERQVGDYAIAGAAAYVESGDLSTITHTRIALTNLGPVPIRAVEAESLLRGRAPTRRLFDQAGRVAATAAQPWSDMRGSAEYRRRVAAMVTRQALRKAWKRAGHGHHG
ncbi:MAG: xanthine dehydrogenase family protein subunit M [bacterium]|nr:xanthine dehydrogenase family protein subunit M [bacterium]